jgi:hypothetical protein
VVAGQASAKVAAMPDRDGVDVGVRGARRGIAMVVVSTGGYLLLLWLFSLLTAALVYVM